MGGVVLVANFFWTTREEFHMGRGEMGDQSVSASPQTVGLAPDWIPHCPEADKMG